MGEEFSGDFRESLEEIFGVKEVLGQAVGVCECDL